MSLLSCRLCNDQTARSPGEPDTIAQLEYTRAVLYQQPRRRAPGEPQHEHSLANLTRGRFNGYMSPATKRHVRRAASTWLRSIFLYRQHLKAKWDPGRPYPTMATLTLPVEQRHDDRELHRTCLMPFLQRLKREHGLEQYLWRAEAQENGNLHYHVILDRFVDKDALTSLWLLSVDALGYRERYFATTGSLYPPCTEIHAVHSQVKDPKTGELRDVDPVDYLVDYFLEIPEEQGDEESNAPPSPHGRPMIGRHRYADGRTVEYRTRAVAGRVWGMSDAIRDLRPPRAVVTNRLALILEGAAARRRLRRVTSDRATIYFGSVHRALAAAHKPTARLVTRHYLFSFGHVYPKAVGPAFTRYHRLQDPRSMWLDLEAFTTPTRIVHDGIPFEFPTSHAAHHFTAAAAKYAA